MSELLAITAFLMAFGAVFLANDAVRKAEHKNEAFIKNHVDKLRAEIDQNRELIDTMGEQLDAQILLQQQADKDLNILKEQLTNQQQQLTSIGKGVEGLLANSSKKAARKKA